MVAKNKELIVKQSFLGLLLSNYTQLRCLVLFVVLLFTGGYTTFIHREWDNETFISSYLNIPLILIFYFGYKWWKKTKIVSLEEMPIRGFIEIYRDNPEPAPKPKKGLQILNIFVTNPKPAQLVSPHLSKPKAPNRPRIKPNMAKEKHIVFDIVGTCVSFDAYHSAISAAIGPKLLAHNITPKFFGYSWITAAELEFTFLSISERYKPCDSTGLAKPALGAYLPALAKFAKDDEKWFAAAHMWDVSAAVKVGFRGAYCTEYEKEACLEIFDTKMDVMADTLPEMTDKIIEASS
ncbi:hypothetical protein G7Y89_g15247 [Cudoniella acicularis]|uniref:Amino acid permease/ SLC12A domain-containing protein n=1 Tax=Cudoniella acicularis TaxID=354080 RepID=A0A8H4VMZ1_9HELO|nr:hypothetical protein G7Y89_g15247 [Cudoniella acicularis]